MLWRSMLVDAAVLRERIVGLGQRSAPSRMAHLLCEMRVRLKAVDLVRNNSFDLPLTQAQLGDALGLSTVHVNRVLQELRRQHLFTLRGGKVTIRDWHGLAELGEFDPSYLCLECHSGDDLRFGRAFHRPEATQAGARVLELRS